MTNLRSVESAWTRSRHGYIQGGDAPHDTCFACDCDFLDLAIEQGEKIQAPNTLTEEAITVEVFADDDGATYCPDCARAIRSEEEGDEEESICKALIDWALEHGELHVSRDGYRISGPGIDTIRLTRGTPASVLRGALKGLVAS